MYLFNKVYGFRLFEEDGGGGGSTETTSTAIETKNGKDLPDDIKAKLDRLAHLEKENKDLISQRDKVKDAKRKEEESKLLEEKKYQELITAKDKEIETLKPQVDEYNSYLSSKRDKIKADLGEKYKPYMDSMKLVDLEDLALTLNSKSPDPNLDKGAPPKKGDIVLSDQQKEEAKVMGLDEETYFNIQKNREKRKAAK